MCVHFLPLTNTVMYFFKCANKYIIILLLLFNNNLKDVRLITSMRYTPVLLCGILGVIDVWCLDVLYHVTLMKHQVSDIHVYYCVVSWVL